MSKFWKKKLDHNKNVSKVNTNFTQFSTYTFGFVLAQYTI